jgi:ATP/maltotriose-dependent transcriptional regulator MalT
MGHASHVVEFQAMTAVIELLEGDHAAVADTVRDIWSNARFQAVGREWKGTHVMTLCLAASSASARGEAERAARLFGAADAVTKAPSEDQWMYWFEDIFESFRSAAHARLDEPTWREAWEQGRAMTVEQAVHYALGEISVP